MHNGPPCRPLSPSSTSPASRRPTASSRCRRSSSRTRGPAPGPASRRPCAWACGEDPLCPLRRARRGRRRDADASATPRCGRKTPSRSFSRPTNRLTTYYEIEVNPLGALFDARVESPGLSRASMRVDPAWDCPGLEARVDAARSPLVRDAPDPSRVAPRRAAAPALARELLSDRPGRGGRVQRVVADAGGPAGFSRAGPLRRAAAALTTARLPATGATRSPSPGRASP